MNADHDMLQRLATLRGSLEQFGHECLKVRTKAGKLMPLDLNRAQLFVHQKLEAQRERTGWVRALILKGRQQGCSTYVAGRFYHKTSMNSGVNTYILTHEQGATDTLFGIVERYHTHNTIAPHVGASNAKELEFDRLDSSYAVATAGSKGAGRGKALSLFHGSEVAFWPNASEHFAASVQGVPLETGTEVILESTSAGAGGEFYERCVEAEAGKSDYQLIFIPWWYSDEYARDPEPGFILSAEEIDGDMSEQEYADTFKLANRQMAWRRGKMQELRDPLLFRREYPATVQDAWTAPPGHEPYVSALAVIRARKRPRHEGAGPLIIGVDPASQGGDRFAASGRRGFVQEFLQHRGKLNHEEAVAWCASLIDKYDPARMNIDAGNIGANIVTSLKNMNPHYAKVVRGINFGGVSEWRNARPKTPGPYNRRAEMYQRGLQWLESTEGAILLDRDDLQADACAPKMKPRLDGFFLIESKVDLKNRGVRSADLWESFLLTFAFNEYLPDYSQPARVVDYGNPDAAVRAAPTPAYNHTPVAGGNGWMA